MDVDKDPGNDEGRGRRRATPLLWISGALASLVLVLGVSGTLSSWTEAILTNDDNTADAAAAVVLEETGPDGLGGTATCTTSGTTSNTATCSTVNKYGDAGVTATGATALEPGDSTTTTVTLTNTGPGDASTFTLTPAACASTYTSGAQQGDPPAVGDDLCSQLEAAVSCVDDAATPATVLTVAATKLSVWSGAETITGGLTSGSAVTCTFTVSLPAATPANYSGQSVAQDLAWTISV